MSGMDHGQVMRLSLALEDVRRERYRQHEMRGEQNLEDGLEYWRVPGTVNLLADARAMQTLGAQWAEVLVEETCEALLAPDRASLRAELIQVAAVAVQWIEAIDRRTA